MTKTAAGRNAKPARAKPAKVKTDRVDDRVLDEAKRLTGGNAAAYVIKSPSTIEIPDPRYGKKKR